MSFEDDEIVVDEITTDYRFTMIPEWVLEIGLSSTALHVYVVLSKHADNRTHAGWAGRQRIADHIGKTKKTVDRCVKELIEAGCLRKEARYVNGEQTSNLWTVVRLDPRTPVSTVGTPVSPRWGHQCRPGGDTSVAQTRLQELDSEELEADHDQPANLAGKSAGRVKRKTRMTEDWIPDQINLDKQRGKYPKLEVDHEVGKFRDYWISQGELRADWNAGLRTWLAKADEYRRERTGERAGGWR